MAYSDLSDEEFQALLQRLKDAVDPPPTPILEGTKGSLYVYGPGIFSVTLLGDNRYRQKGRRYKDIKLFAMGDEETILHMPFKYYRMALEDIGGEEYIEAIERLMMGVEDLDMEIK